MRHLVPNLLLLLGLASIFSAPVTAAEPIIPPGAKLEIVEGTAGVVKLKIDDTNNNSNDYHIFAESNFGGANTAQFWTKSNGDAFVAGSLALGGARNARQAKENAVALDVCLDEREAQALRRGFEALD